MKVAIVAFPGNNCEIETARAATRNGFSAQIFRWNDAGSLEKFAPDLVILPGGFSFEDRGRAGVIAVQEPIFEVIADLARNGKIIWGICNGAQMLVESGFLGFDLALAQNVRRDPSGHVLGSGFFSDWICCAAANQTSAFTKFLPEQSVLHLPIAHAEGRFVSPNSATLQAQTLFKYVAKDGSPANHFPENPNGSQCAAAAVGNAAGTICAMMPHPERFFKTFDGDKIFHSIAKFIRSGAAPKSVEIKTWKDLATPKIGKFERQPRKIYAEKKLIIADNEAFSISTASGQSLEKTILFEISAPENLAEKIKHSGLLFNPSKEFLVDENLDQKKRKKSFAVREFDDDQSANLGQKLSEIFGAKISVQIYKIWHFQSKDSHWQSATRMLANTSSAEILEC